MPGKSRGNVTPRKPRSNSQEAAQKSAAIPLPFPGSIPRNFAAFSPDAHHAQSSENAENYRGFKLVAPTGFEPVL